MGLVVRKPDFLLGNNKDEDQSVQFCAVISAPLLYALRPYPLKSIYEQQSMFQHRENHILKGATMKGKNMEHNVCLCML